MRVSPVTIELSFRRAEGQFSYTVGACKEAVLGQRPVRERSQGSPQKIGQSGVPIPHQRNISIRCGYVDHIKGKLAPSE